MAPVTRLRYDGVETYLAAELDAGTNTIQFSSALVMDGNVPVPTLNTDEYLVLTIMDANYVLKEIVYLTSYTAGNTVGFIDRAQEGTSASNHAVSSKVVHSATAEDFIRVQEHDEDENAHIESITAIAQGIADAEMADHIAAANPHDQYVLKDSPQFDTGLTIPDGADLIIESGGELIVQPGGKIIVQEGAEIHIDGRLFIHGHEIIVSTTEPTDPTANVVWIQTHGG